MKSHIKTFTVNPHDIETHELASLTPIVEGAKYNSLKESIDNLGQLQPIVMYRGKLIDGRHRLKAAKDLGIGGIVYINHNPNASIEEVEELIMNGFENRRHQSKTQRMIFAYRYFLRQKEQGSDTTQGKIAEKFGLRINDLSLVKKLYKVSSELIIETLFNGGLIELSSGKKTDNIRAIIKYFETISGEMVEDAFKEPIDITDDEMEMINAYVDNLSENHNSLVLKAMANKLLAKTK